MTHDSPVPNGWRLVPDAELRRRDDGKVLLGGSPFRLLRLSKAGAKQVSDWFAGAPIESGPSAIRLARRLLNNGMAHPVPLSCEKQPADTGVTGPELTIVIPVKDDITGLIATLNCLNSTSGCTSPIIIVDDGSSTSISSLDMPGDAQIIRNEVATGPGPARNRGFERVSTELVAFVDAGVTFNYRDLLQLAQHLADPDVVAAAPRVRSGHVEYHAFSDRPTPDGAVPDSEAPGTFPTGQSSAIAQYERNHSPLDLGQQPGPVKPGSRVSYVPTACLLIRSAVLRHISEDSFVFDPGLRFGEDVDLEWRLGAEGTIRYDPSVVVAHPPRDDILAFVRQRIGYGSAAAPLAERHGQIVAPFRSSRSSAVLLILALTGNPALAGLLAARSAALTGRALRGRVPDHQAEAIGLTTVAHLTSGMALGQTAIRSWWPAALAGLAIPFARAPVSRLISWGLAAKIWRHRQDENKIVQVAIGLLDDLSYGLGLWRGAWTERSLRALRPDLD